MAKDFEIDAGYSDPAITLEDSLIAGVKGRGLSVITTRTYERLGRIQGGRRA